MKKFLLTLGTVAMGLSSLASTRVLYQQNFETVPDAAAAGWSFGGASMNIGSDEYGKFLDLSLGHNNGRTGQVKWGQDIYMKDGQPLITDDVYNISFEFCIKAMPNNQSGTEFTLFTNHEQVWNQGYRLPWNPSGVWDNFVLDISQVNYTIGDTDMNVAVNAPIKEEVDGENINRTIDASNAITLGTGAMYTAQASVNVKTREVEYSVLDVQGDPKIFGTYTVPETDTTGAPVSMYAEGLYVMLSRYDSEAWIDNILITCESGEDIANAPTVALTRLGQTEGEEPQIDLNLRAYTITFIDGETLHLIGTDNSEIDVEWVECEGNYVYETTTSGTLKAWTTSGTATSEVITVDVDCTPCILPAAVASISSVEAGYGKTYTLSVDNSNVPLRPTIFMNYEFIGENGEKISKKNVTSGEKVTVSEKGVLKISTVSFGYQENTVNVDNDIKFVEKKIYDFARLDDSWYNENGFTNWDILNTGEKSGFTNWTGRQYLYYYDAATAAPDPDDPSKTVYTPVYPFGFIADDNTTNVLYNCTLGDNTDGSKWFEGLNIFEGFNIGFLKHIGLFNNQLDRPDSKPIIIKNLDATDFVVVNYIGNYGGTSNHPIVNTVEEYYAQLAGEDIVFKAEKDGVLNEETGKYDVTYGLYRISDACTKISVFAMDTETGIENVIADEQADPRMNDPYYYSLEGIRYTEPTHPGIYIHKGKKIVVK